MIDCFVHLHPREDGVDIIALVLVPPAAASRVALMHPLQRRVGIAGDGLLQVVPAVPEVAWPLVDLFGVSGHGGEVARPYHSLF